MYLRTVKAKGADGVEFEYIRLVEAYWENGHSKQRVVANLGRKDVLAPHLESLIELLGGGKKTKANSLSRGEHIEATVAACWGPMLVARSLWREFGLASILDSLAPKTKTVQKVARLALADRVLVLVANRLCRPGSEHALAQWLESDFVCGRDGKRILARWKQQGRVRVDLGWLQEWYRTLDQLLAHKDGIELELFGRLRDLFHLQADMVFYDLTSTYFEGAGPAGLADFGYSRDGKPRNRQVQVGLVMINGWPIAHHVFDGGLPDSETVESVLKDLQQRFGLRRVILVGDRGMVTIENLALLRQRGQGYLVGLRRRRNARVNRYIEAAAQGRWQECPVGITCQFGNYLRVTEGYLRMKAMETRLRARRSPFGLPAEGALGSGQEPTSEQRCTFHHAFFEHAATPGAERLIVFPSKQRYPFDSPRRSSSGKSSIA